MQIDFHHAVTYVIARFAGYNDPDAQTIAHAAQYVDDSTETGFIHFDNGMRFYRQASAHPTKQPINLDDDTDAQSWLPFHFLPGALGNDYIEKLVCRPNSQPAQKMVEYALRAVKEGLPCRLHRLGIAAHVLADTYAHQGFVGLNDMRNLVKDIDCDHPNKPSGPLLLPTVGHAQANTFPDMPYLTWAYTDANDNLLTHNNTDNFLDAAETLCKMFQKSLGQPDNGLTPEQRITIGKNFVDFADEDGDKRHQRWLESLKQGFGGLDPVNLAYDAKAWKDAINSETIVNWLEHKFTFTPAFMSSDWKLFHDAAKDQRHDVLTKVLPAFGILEY